MRRNWGQRVRPQEVALAASCTIRFSVSAARFHRALMIMCFFSPIITPSVLNNSKSLVNSQFLHRKERTYWSGSGSSCRIREAVMSMKSSLTWHDPQSQPFQIGASVQSCQKESKHAHCIDSPSWMPNLRVPAPGPFYATLEATTRISKQLRHESKIPQYRQ
jgi:hypothetical protein